MVIFLGPTLLNNLMKNFVVKTNRQAKSYAPDLLVRMPKSVIVLNQPIQIIIISCTFLETTMFLFETRLAFQAHAKQCNLFYSELYIVFNSMGYAKLHK